MVVILYAKAILNNKAEPSFQTNWKSVDSFLGYSVWYVQIYLKFLPCSI